MHTAREAQARKIPARRRRSVVIISLSLENKEASVAQNHEILLEPRVGTWYFRAQRENNNV